MASGTFYVVCGVLVIYFGFTSDLVIKGTDLPANGLAVLMGLGVIARGGAEIKAAQDEAEAGSE